MKSRVVKSVGERAEGVWLSTFHAFCLEQILRAANPDVQPLDDIDHKILLRRNIGQLDLKLFPPPAGSRRIHQRLRAPFSRAARTSWLRPTITRDSCTALRAQHDRRQKIARTRRAAGSPKKKSRGRKNSPRVYRVSEQLLRERNLLTFGAQLMHTAHLLQTDDALRAKIQDKYRYILVDEFQDTNIAQLELLWLLAGERRNIVAVGDDDQAIYRFRGASFGSFTIFLKRFCGINDAKLGPASKKFLVSLSQNYRSTQRILRVAGEVIQHNEKSPLLPPKALTTENREGKKFAWSNSARPKKKPSGSLPKLIRLHDAGTHWRNFRRALPQTQPSHRTARRACAAAKFPSSFANFRFSPAPWCAICSPGSA